MPRSVYAFRACYEDGNGPDMRQCTERKRYRFRERVHRSKQRMGDRASR